jgi:hypothetical protein
MKTRMNTIILSLAFASAFGLAGSAFAQSADSNYCNALSQSYTRYAQANDGRSHNAPPADVAAAMSKCDSAPASAIPVLEKTLTDAKISLPPR